MPLHKLIDWSPFANSEVHEDDSVKFQFQQAVQVIGGFLSDGTA